MGRSRLRARPAGDGRGRGLPGALPWGCNSWRALQSRRAGADCPHLKPSCWDRGCCWAQGEGRPWAGPQSHCSGRRVGGQFGQNIGKMAARGQRVDGGVRKVSSGAGGFVMEWPEQSRVRWGCGQLRDGGS